MPHKMIIAHPDGTVTEEPMDPAMESLVYYTDDPTSFVKRFTTDEISGIMDSNNKDVKRFRALLFSTALPVNRKSEDVSQALDLFTGLGLITPSRKTQIIEGV